MTSDSAMQVLECPVTGPENVLYAAGDASREEFGSRLDKIDHLEIHRGFWDSTASNQSSN